MPRIPSPKSPEFHRLLNVQSSRSYDPKCGASSMPIPIQKQKPRCPKCNATFTVRKGRRRNRLQTIPLFQCNECQHRFTGNPGRNKSYPLRHILEALSLYNLGHSISETQRILRAKPRMDIPAGTILSWTAIHRSSNTDSHLDPPGPRTFS